MRSLWVAPVLNMVHLHKANSDVVKVLPDVA